MLCWEWEHGQSETNARKNFYTKRRSFSFQSKNFALIQKKVAAGKQVLVRLYSLIFWDHVL